MAELHARMVERAAEIAGGFDQLGARLGVSRARLRIWARGTIALPDDVFLQLVDVISEADGPPPAADQARRGGPRP